MDCSFFKRCSLIANKFSYRANAFVDIYASAIIVVIIEYCGRGLYIMRSVHAILTLCCHRGLQNYGVLVRKSFVIHMRSIRDFNSNSFVLHVDLAQFIHGFQCFVHGILRFSWISHFFCVNHSYLFRDFKVIYS